MSVCRMLIDVPGARAGDAWRAVESLGGDVLAATHLPERRCREAEEAVKRLGGTVTWPKPLGSCPEEANP